MKESSKEKLYYAIQNAIRPGSCRYLEADKPCCVMGQLFYDELGPERLKEWDAKGLTIGFAVSTLREPTEYDLGLLKFLQATWDTRAFVDEGFVDEGQLRSIMFCAVSNWPTED